MKKINIEIPDTFFKLILQEAHKNNMCVKYKRDKSYTVAPQDKPRFVRGRT